MARQLFASCISARISSGTGHLVAIDASAIQREYASRQILTCAPQLRAGLPLSLLRPPLVPESDDPDHTPYHDRHPEAYTITVDSIVDGEKTHEVLRARRKGDCAK